MWTSNVCGASLCKTSVVRRQIPPSTGQPLTWNSSAPLPMLHTAHFLQLVLVLVLGLREEVPASDKLHTHRGTRPRPPARVGARPHTPGKLSARPHTPGRLGARPHTPGKLGARPHTLGRVGTRVGRREGVGIRVGRLGRVGIRGRVCTGANDGRRVARRGIEKGAVERHATVNDLTR